jgi:hypothetical protein
MTLRNLAVCLAGAALIGIGATFLFAQPPQGAPAARVVAGRDTLRAGIVKLQTEVEMLRLDYELAREGLLEDLKLRRGLRMAGGVMQLGFAIQSAVNDATAQTPGSAPKRDPEQDRKQAAEAKQEEKKEAADDAAFIGERKKELARLFTLLSQRQLDLEDAERTYREGRR